MDAAARSWAVPRPLADDAVLCTSECVTNALVHGRPPVRVAVSIRGANVRVEVHDGSEALPHMSSPSGTRPGGRGVRIIDLVSSDWGVTRDGAGKSVWFEIPAGAPPVQPSPLTLERATRDVLKATTVPGVVGVVTRFVERWGASCTPPGARPGHELPVDLTFGVADPLVPACPPDSPARAYLEALLPRLVEDARMMVNVLRWGGRSLPS